MSGHYLRVPPRKNYPGVATAATEVLLTCPVCGIPNFGERGLRAHCCHAKPDRARLTPDEIQLARQRATNREPVTLNREP